MKRKLKFSSRTDLRFRGEKDIKKQVLEFVHAHAVKIAVAMVVVASLIACIILFVSRDNSKTVEVNGKTITYQASDTNYIGIVQPESFNVLTSDDADIYYVNQIVYSSLFTLDDELNIKPDLVESYTADAQEGSVSITLRNDIKFSDGTELTADDVKFTVKQIKSAGENGPYYNYASKIDSVTTEGKHSLVIKFASPSDAALDNLVFPVVSSGSYSADQSFAVGSGPYAYNSYEQGKAVQMKVNDLYYGKKAKNNLVLTVLPAENQIVGLMTMDAVTFSMCTDMDAEEIASDKNLNCTSIISNEMEFIGFNHENPILGKRNVRAAIAHAIDTDEIIEENFGDSAVKSDSIYYPGFMGVKGGISFDRKISAKNLKKAGYKDYNKDGILEDNDGNELVVRLLIDASNRKRTDAAEIIEDNLASVGIKVVVEAVEPEEFTQRLESGDFDMYLAGMKVDKQFNLTDLFGEYNYGKYADEKVISKVAELERSLDAQQQKQAFEEAKDVLNSEIPYFPVCYKKYYLMSVKTYESDINGTFFDCYRGVPVSEWKKTVIKEGKEKNS